MKMSLSANRTARLGLLQSSEVLAEGRVRRKKEWISGTCYREKPVKFEIWRLNNVLDARVV